jgi:hypothetical protein
MAAIRNRTRIAETLIADRSAWLLTNAAKARNLHRSHEFTQGIFCRAAQEEAVPRGDKSTYTDKQERKAQHIEQSYESRGVPEKEAERRAWATVNKDDGGGKRAGGSGRGKSTGHPAAHKGGRIGGAASAARSPASRSAAAKKAAATRKRNAAHAANSNLEHA